MVFSPRDGAGRAVLGLRRYVGQYGYRVLVGLVLTALFALHAVHRIELPLIGQFENMAYDLRLRLGMPGGVDERVVIVDVDERSLAAEGRWPWSRVRIAELVDALFEHYGVSVVGFDMVFAEPERLDGVDVAARAAEEAGRSDVTAFLRGVQGGPDRRFAASLSGRDTILGFYFNPPGGAEVVSGTLPPPLLPAEIAEMLDIPALEAAGYGANLPVLQSAARAGGFFDNPLNDADGVFRRIPLVQSFEGSLYTSLAVAVSEVALGEPVQFSDANDALAIGSHRIPVDQDMAALIPYRGAQGSFPYISATDVLTRRADADLIEGAIVLVGTTAPGLFDLRNTPVQKIYPGVEIHANVIAGILDGRFLSRPAYTVALELAQLLIIGLALSFTLPALGPNRGTLVTAIVLVATLGLNAYLWTAQSNVLPVSSAVLLILLHYVYVTSYGFIVEARNKKAIMVQFGRYVPEEIVDEMSRDPGHYSLEGERRELTVMFSDIRNFTQLSETLEPQAVTRLMNAYLSRMTEVIHDHHGTIDKYIGDAIMAFWGAPISDAKHAHGAVASALAMRELLPEINESFRSEGWPAIRIGIGLNTGVVAVGNMGSDFRMAYTVMGDAVNLASRVESLTKIYRAPILVTEYTAAQAPAYYYRPLDRVRVRGRHESVEVLEPMCPADAVPGAMRREAEAFDAFLGRYRAGEWNAALGELEAMERRFGERPHYEVYRARIVALRNDPPARWDGVFDLGS